MTTPKDILDFIKKNDIEFVDFKFIDLLGTWQHLQVPIGAVNEGMLEEGAVSYTHLTLPTNREV